MGTRTRGLPTDNGRAYEWAVARELSAQVSCEIELDNTALNAKKAFEAASPQGQQHFVRSASVAVKHILELQQIPLGVYEPLKVWMPPDSAGQKGDVRDVILICKDYAFGISCKNNHEAYKHSRLSGRLDWVKKWGLDQTGCSEEYWQSVKPVFDELTSIRALSGGTALFSTIPNLHETVYEPVLSAFQTELYRVFHSSLEPALAVESFVKYIIGAKDFFKVISRGNAVTVQKFNFSNSLAGSRSHLPTKLIGLDRQEGSAHSINVRFDRGYVFNLRIHSASSKVESSLKFDIQAIGLPSTEIYRHQIGLENL